MRVGMGYDSHRFVAGDHVFIGGVRIPCRYGVMAHSDGDVLLHALVDALLGAAVLGDIGTHFPDTEAQFKHKDSCYFVMTTMNLLKQQHLQLCHMDATIIAETPKLMPYIPAIREQISDLVQLPMTHISVKAKSNEKMGWIGREEGLAAMVVVSLTCCL